jgi:hypothetical protein
MGLKGRSEQQPDMVVFSLDQIERFGGVGACGFQGEDPEWLGPHPAM